MNVDFDHSPNVTLADMNPYNVIYDDLNEATQSYLKLSTFTIAYLGMCLSCTIWQIMTVVEMVWRKRKWLHYLLLFQIVACFIIILCSTLNPFTPVNCIVVSLRACNCNSLTYSIFMTEVLVSYCVS